MSIFRLLIFFLFSLSSVHNYAQEICDNAIDDDGDGLIDLNDEDCQCQALVPSSLIPNFSFEEMTCCPSQNAQLDCAVDWVQASAPTTDYVHICDDYLGNSNIGARAPLPFPDGEGGVGFRDGQQNQGPGYKEYVGACLNESMEIGVAYTLDFFVGFRDNIIGSQDFTMAIFASTDCANLPFSNNITTGCPLNTGAYSLLGEFEVSGSNEWVNTTFEFEADQAYNVMVLGPACAANPNYIYDPYFYVDRLALAESSSFGVPLESITGQICENNLVLSTENNVNYSYQWYLDGVALLGETDPNLNLRSDTAIEGTYLVTIITPDGCLLSSEYILRIPPYYASDQQRVCEDEGYEIADTIIMSQGYHEITILAEDGCDSIIQLDLDIIPSTAFYFEDTICEGEVYNFLEINTSSPGLYRDTLINAAGCDSIITVLLEVLPAGTGIDLVESITLLLGENINIIPSQVDPNIVEFLWIDKDGNILSTGDRIMDYVGISATTITVQAVDSNGCNLEKSIEIKIDDSNVNLYIPNVFSPNSDGVNDTFVFYNNESLKMINRFEIYDRWGELVYKMTDIENEPFYGWDGNFKNEEAITGIYTYLIEAVFLDQSTKVFSGDVTLLR